MKTLARRGLLLGMAGAGLGCAPLVGARPRARYIMTVLGPIPVDKAGMTLAHEHITADLRPWDTRPVSTVSDQEIIDRVTPFVREARSLGCHTIIDCTATNLGRNPYVLKKVAQASGVNIVTCTGLYAAADEQFLPGFARNTDAATLAQLWAGEWREGINGSGVRPGLVKLGFNGGKLTEIERNLIDAAALTHKRTGLTIGAHVGPWRTPIPGANAASTHEQLDRLEAAGVSARAYIWFHAQNEAEIEQHELVARRGAWISFDGVAPETIEQHTELIVKMKAVGRLNQVLVSHDAGWYSQGEPEGGTFRPFSTAFTTLIPRLRNASLTDADIATIFIKNPANAFALSRRIRRHV